MAVTSPHHCSASMPASLRAAVIQQAYQGSYQKTAAALEAALNSAHQQGAQLALLPELHHLPYFCQSQDPAHFAMAESIPGPTSEQLCDWARRFNLVLVGSIFEKRMSGVYHNTAIVIENDGSLAGMYRKMHIPDDPGFNEKFYFTPGSVAPGFTPIATHLGRLGVLVCWDQWFPEAARLMALAGAELLLYPTAIGWSVQESAQQHTLQLSAWQCIQRSHAIANHLPVLCANRWQYEPAPDEISQTQAVHDEAGQLAAPARHGIDFWGNSFICGAQGETLAQAASQNDQVLIADIARAPTETQRCIWPFFRDRRVDAYGGLSHLCTLSDPHPVRNLSSPATQDH